MMLGGLRTTAFLPNVAARAGNRNRTPLALRTKRPLRLTHSREVTGARDRSRPRVAESPSRNTLDSRGRKYLPGLATGSVLGSPAFIPPGRGSSDDPAVQ